MVPLGRSGASEYAQERGAGVPVDLGPGDLAADRGLVVLGGGIGASPLLLRPVRGAAAALVPITARIETSLLGDRAALQGAIAISLQAARAQLLSQGAGSDARKNVVTMRSAAT